MSNAQYSLTSAEYGLNTNHFIADDTFPELSCPQSYTIELTDSGSRTISFPEAGRAATPNDADVTYTYTPDQWIVSAADVGKVKRIDVKATDAADNSRECAFTVDIKAGPCQDWALTTPMNGRKTCTRNDNDNGYVCVMECNDRHYFYDDPTVPERTFTCTDGNAFVPGGLVPNCVREYRNNIITNCLDIQFGFF